MKIHAMRPLSRSRPGNGMIHFGVAILIFAMRALDRKVCLFYLARELRSAEQLHKTVGFPTSR